MKTACNKKTEIIKCFNCGIGVIIQDNKAVSGDVALIGNKKVAICYNCYIELEKTTL